MYIYHKINKLAFFRGMSSKKMMILLCNVLLVVATLISVLLYSSHLEKQQQQTKLDSFISAVESMKQISENYLATEEIFAKNWANYIENNNMSMDEALNYIKLANTQSDRFAHIVDMDTFEAYSTNKVNGSNYVNCYKYMKTEDIKVHTIFISNMEHMFSDNYDDVSVLGKYRVNEMQVTVISVGTRVTLRTDDGHKDYLLLRIIPLESMKKIWIFPLQYSSAEVGIITNDGSYVIPSASMKSENFMEFIRAYNYADNYNGINELQEKLGSTSGGTLMYKNSKGEDCYWYYSAFNSDSGLDILGYIPAENMRQSSEHWFIIVMICLWLILMLAINGTYILMINRNLRMTAAAAEKANKAKTEFLSSMSHDIRTPMNAVLGMTEIAKKNISNTSFALECLDKVSLAGNHLLTLINDILDISKVESGKMYLNPARFSIQKLVQHLVNMMRPQMAEKDISFEGQHSSFKYEYLIADELRLNQIFINILNNSVKYTGHGGKIALDVFEEPDEQEKNVTLIYRVTDNGIGMSEEFQKTMYDSFNRAENSRTNKIQGSGLGLAIVKQMVELMNGTIECESTPGSGTVFTVRIVLPIAEDQHEEASAASDSSADNELSASEFCGMKILVAEDNDLNWEIVSAILSEYGVVCSRAENGSICVDMLRSAPYGTYDLVLMDIQMPVMNGKEAAMAIRADERDYLKHIPIAAMTADAFADDIKECLECGMNAHISKPVDIKVLLRFLRSVKNGTINDRQDQKQ